MNFISFIPSGVKVCISRRPPSYLKEGDLSKTMRGGYMISNNTAMAEVFSRTDHKFDLMYARRAFVHWYNAMEEG